MHTYVPYNTIILSDKAYEETRNYMTQDDIKTTVTHYILSLQNDVQTKLKDKLPISIIVYLKQC